MQTAELYAGLDWGPFELLIPQHSISDAKLGAGAEEEAISIDDAADSAFRNSMGGSCRPGAMPDGMQSLLVIGGRRYRTALMPQVVALEDGARGLGDCRLLRDLLARHGLHAARFQEWTVESEKSSDDNMLQTETRYKISYTVDMKRFTEQSAAGESQ